jgi:hypothetical protein
MFIGQIHIFIRPKNGGNLGQRLDRNGKLLNLGQHVELRQEGPGARKKAMGKMLDFIISSVMDMTISSNW